VAVTLPSHSKVQIKKIIDLVNNLEYGKLLKVKSKNEK